MRKFSTYQLESVRQKHDLREIVGASVELKPTATEDMVACCPFHNENTPSFRVNKVRYHCFGCGVHGDAFSWLTNILGVSFPEAVNRLAGDDLPEVGSESNIGPIKPLSTPYDADAVARIITTNKWYQRSLRFHLVCAVDSCPELKSYLRRFENFDEDFGYYPLNETPSEVDTLIEAGLHARDANGRPYARLRGRITIPLRNRSGHILGFLGRAIPGITPPDAPKYINPPTTAAFQKKRYVYGLNKVAESEPPPFVVEGALDCLAMSEYDTAVAIMGCNLSVQQAEIIKHYFGECTILFDGDMAGLEGAVEACKTCISVGLPAQAYLLTDNKDPGESAKEIFNSSPGRLVDASFFIQSRLMSNHVTDEYDRSKLDEMIAPYVKDNIDKGWPHYNVVDWVMQAYPQHAAEIKEATLQMVRDVEVANGKKRLKETNIKAFIKAWMKPSREVRLKHAKGK